MRNFIIVGAMLALLTSAAGAANPPMQEPRQFTYKKTIKDKLDYLLFLPQGYEAKGEKKWPLILFLHGAGERGNDIWKVAIHGPPKNATNRVDFPFIVVSPQCPENQVWDNDTLLRLLNEIEAKHRVDPTRVYLTGLSMGGYGTWSLGLTHPERFAAIAPICGGGQIINILLAGPRAEPLKSMGIWAFHGAKDSVVPLDESQRMVNALSKIGVQAKLTIYPEADHNSWTETYQNPEFYQWLLQHQRAPKAK
jgi:predicted peptidase